jgi:hypothetical protein
MHSPYIFKRDNETNFHIQFLIQNFSSYCHILCSRSTPGDELIQKKKAKHKRKGKLPKNYDQNTTPDPQRWLPKHERAGFRKKKDRRNKDIGKGTQGAATGASDQ